jgi:hypothetical protein
MRLTLRTLLAYRDGVLSPAETSDLHQRIRKTEVASKLLRRVENLIKNKQLLSPKLSGEGLGADANTVAEYLDDSLASEQVPEFERICIAESDLVLAELAHCHQLLAEALNSQVVVSQELKTLVTNLTNPQNQVALQRRLKIGGKAVAPTESIRRLDDAHAAKLDEPADLAETVEAKTDAALTAVPLQVQAPMLASGGGSIKPQGLDLERPQLAHEVPEYLVGQRSGGWRIPLAIGAMVALLSVLAWQALGPLGKVRDMFVATNTVTDADADSTKSTENDNPKGAADSDSAEIKQGINKPNAETPSSPSPSSTTSDAGTASEVASNSDSEVSTTEVPLLSDSVNLEAVPPQADQGNTSFNWSPGPDDAKAVLFSRNTKTNGLQRITANSSLPAEVELVVPPAMRPTLSLAGHCTWSVCGPTLMQLSDTENVRITTSLCRALTQCGTLGREVTIVAPTGPVQLQFKDATSMAAIEVAFRAASHGPITDQLVFKPFMIVVAVEGQVTVTSTREGGEARNIRLVVGEGVAFSNGEPVEFELGAIPSWYRAGNDRPVDLLAAADLHKMINNTEDAKAQLTSLCSDSRPETAALAIQSSMLLGEWGSFVDGCLNNESLRNHWSAAIGLAEQLIAASEQNAEALRAAFESAHPGRGETLFTLLVGAADSSKAKGMLPKLVESLGSAELDERVLAAHQLHRLTGKNLGFQPSVPNRAVLQQWRRAIATGPSLLPIDTPIWEAKKPELP